MKFAAILAVLFCSSAACAQEQTFEAHYGGSNVPVVDVYIGNKGPYQFSIDTGATYTLMKEDIFEEAGLTYANSNIASFYPPMTAVNGEVPAKPSNLVSLSISGLNNSLKTRIMEFPNAYFGGEVDGVLGLYELRGATLSNDVLNETLRVTYSRVLGVCDRSDTASACREVSPKLPVQKVEKGNFRGWALVDTGNHSTSAPIMTSSQSAQDVWQHLEAVGEPTSIFTQLPEPNVKTFRLRDVSLFGVEGCEIEIILPEPYGRNVISNRVDENLGSLLAIGWQSLKNTPFSVTIPLDGSPTEFDLGDDCITPTPNSIGFLQLEAYIPETEGIIDQNPEQIRSAVLQGKARPASLRVSDLVPGSPIWVEGVRHGDYITAFVTPNGKRMTLQDSDFVQSLRTLSQSEGEQVELEYVDVDGEERVARIVTRKSRLLGEG